MTTHAIDPQAAAETPLSGALWLAERQFVVFAADHPGAERCAGIGYGHDANTCTDRGKHPAEPFTKATLRDEHEVRRLFAGAPRNVGVYVGGSRGAYGEQLLVMDSDRPGAIEDTAKALGHEHTPTMRVHTAKGHHDYYWAPPGASLGNGLGALKGKFDGDVRAGNAYVIALGSVHATGVVYTLENPEQPPVAAPAWLLEALQARPSAPARPATDIVIPADRHDTYTRRVVQAECDAITQAADGEQNNAINTAAFSLGTLVGVGALTEGEARADLLAAAHAGNHPEGRARATIESGLRAGMAQPRHPWPPVARADGLSGLLIPEQAGGDPEPSHDAHPDAWDEPLPLAAPPPLPLDVHRLGGIGVYANAVAGSLQMPVDIPAFLGLAAASVAVGGRRTVSPKPDWVEPVTLYVMPVAAPGEKKSPALGHMARPIYDEQARRRAEDRVAVARDQQERRIAEACVANAEALVIKATTADKRMAARGNLDSARMDLENLGDPKILTQLIADDTTPEAATSLLAEQGERLGVLSTEGSFLGNVGGRYSKEANPEIALKGWSQEPHTVNRKNAPPLFVERPNFSLGLAVQPGLLTGMGETGDVFEARGLMGRFVYAMPASRVGERTYDTTPIPDALRASYHAAITRMMTTIWDDCETREMNLDPDAQAAFRAFWEALEARYKNAGDLASIEGWANKLPGQVLRIAAVLTLFESPDALTVPGRVMVDVIALVPYMVGHAKLVADLMSAERQSTLGPARAVLAWLRKTHPEKPVSAAEVHRGVHGQKWCTSTEDVDQALALLERFGWLRLAPVPERRGSTGRLPKPRFEVHPRALEQPR
ncbi:DUF3987 domain-containing protein [Streptomyces sp. NPDC001584]|uniref:DUF3987 domain-containing protein n=1 Tax=Streptomyces sp. NPDC001584 TaxID=3154521 RepID=UPI00333420E1